MTKAQTCIIAALFTGLLYWAINEDAKLNQARNMSGKIQVCMMLEQHNQQCHIGKDGKLVIVHRAVTNE